MLVITEGAADIVVRRPWSERQRKVADDHPRRTRRSTTSIRRSASAGPTRRPTAAACCVALKPKHEREQTSTAVIQRLRRADQRGHRHGASISRRSRTSTSAARITKSRVSSTRCNRATPRRSTGSRRSCATRSPSSPGLRDVTTDLYISNPQMMVEVDREKAAVYGITIDQVRQELFNAFGIRQVATIYTPSNDYQVILESKPEFQADPSRSARSTSRPRAGNPQRRRRSAAASAASACRPARRSRSRR